MLAQHDMVALGVVGAALGGDHHHVGVLQFHLGAQVLQFDDVRLGDVLHGGFGGQLVGALVARDAGNARQFHGDLAALHGELAGHVREFLEHGKRIEIAHGHQHQATDHDAARHQDAQCADQPAMPPGGADGAFDVNAVRSPPATRRRVQCSRDRTAHALPAGRVENRPPHPPIIRRRNGKIACECGTGAAGRVRRNSAAVVCLVAAPDGKPEHHFSWRRSWSIFRRSVQQFAAENATNATTNARKCPPRPSRRGRAGRGSAEIRNRRRRVPSRPSRASMASSLSLQRMQIEHVVGRVGDLRLGQRVGAPIGQLLLLGDVLAEQVLGQILQAMLVGVGATQPRGDLGAVDRLRHHAEPLVEHRDIEAREVEDLEFRGIGEQPLEVRRAADLAADLHHVGRAVAGRELHHAEPVAMRARVPWSRCRSRPRRCSAYRSGRSPRCRRMVMRPLGRPDSTSTRPQIG